MEQALIAQLHDDLSRARFSVDALESLWGPEAGAALDRGFVVPALRAVEGSRSPAATLARLFVLGLTVSADTLADALPSLGVEGAVRLGLVSVLDHRAQALLDVRPYSFVDAHGAGEWWIVSDLGELARGAALAEDHVLGVGGASMTLSGLMLDREVDRVLDLGTGCGIQALHATRHAQHVVATDISQRALNLARLNAELNRVDSIEFRLGSLFEPVAGERFDHVISNPPFVITPRVEGVPEYEYRDAGLVGDDLVRLVVTEVGKYLTPGGVAQLLANWEYSPDGLHRVREWVSTTGLDAWVIEREVQSPEQYAETWIRDGGTRPTDADFNRLYSAWLDDFERRAVRGVGFGYVLLRAPGEGTQPLQRFERMHDRLASTTAALGSHLSASLSAHDWQSARDDKALARESLVVASDVTEERHYWPGEPDPTVMNLRQGSGFGRTVPLDTVLAALVGACDGELSVAAICGALAQLLEVDEGALRDDVLPRVRELVTTGFLLPAA